MVSTVSRRPYRDRRETAAEHVIQMTSACLCPAGFGAVVLIVDRLRRGVPSRHESGAGLLMVVRVVHGTIWVLTAFVLALVTIPPLAFAIAGLQSAMGPSAPTTKDVVFYAWVPALAIATTWSCRRLNRWVDRRAGWADDRCASRLERRRGAIANPLDTARYLDIESFEIK